VAPPLTSSTTGDRQVLPSAWLSLGPASRVVGVDPDTLRRWADDGRVPCYTTPGGHRRFPRVALERLAAARPTGRVRPLATLGATPERLSRAYRRSYADTAATEGRPRGDDLRDSDREAFRLDGRRLVEVMLVYLDAPDQRARGAAEVEAGLLARELARRLVRSGRSLPESVALFVNARQPFLAELGSIGRRRNLDAARLSGLYEEASTLLDRLLLQLMAQHADGDR
jgi:excisionase family DNA binding protein